MTTLTFVLASSETVNFDNLNFLVMDFLSAKDEILRFVEDNRNFENDRQREMKNLTTIKTMFCKIFFHFVFTNF